MALTGYVSGLIIQSVPTKGNMKVESFTASGTFTPPAGVTYAVATIKGGGGASGSTAGVGGSSSVAFAAGTQTAVGGSNATGTIIALGGVTPAVNSGLGAVTASGLWAGSPNIQIGSLRGGDGATIVAGGVVTPGVGITVTVGAGGTAGAGTVAGGTGYVYISYMA